MFIKNYLYLILIAFLAGCSPSRIEVANKNVMAGEYQSIRLKKHLDLNEDGTYMIWNLDSAHLPVFGCDYSSKGKWGVLGKEIVELVSEDNYLEQKGYEYNVKLENELSEDSIYLVIRFNEDFLKMYGNESVLSEWILRHSKIISTTETFIKVEKTKFLSGKIPINLSLYSNTAGTFNEVGRPHFIIFRELMMDTDKYNYLTVELPYFDICFFEFTPYKHELFYIKDENTMIWRGEEWKRKR